jgi:hypothetical protein
MSNTILDDINNLLNEADYRDVGTGNTNKYKSMRARPQRNVKNPTSKKANAPKSFFQKIMG